MTASNTSGMSGEVWIESYTADVTEPVPVMVALCVDADLAIEYANLSGLPAFSATLGMADIIAVVSERLLIRAAGQYRLELGGTGAEEARQLVDVERTVPDLRRIASPMQLRECAVHAVLEIAFYTSHELAQDTMFSERAIRHAEKFELCWAGLNLSINSDPDSDHDADTMRNSSVSSLIRV
jgi:hypothetical protein